ncbi:PREDICTED: uncharacterized protein LOC109185561 [Ipomoea nil]|uniref:uncharacterized protein LOC109185561 n=1 Tax=Ipomoea nil TaxID=35883 RepID=UPI000901FC86|nr:PREDICTED: uncharacterized protein LOC109185561 [Ipomoea nil]
MRRFKMNTDAALDVTREVMGLGWVLRDDAGQFLTACSRRVAGRYTVVEAEALCIREATIWLRDTGMGDVDIETDSQLCYHALNSAPFNSALGFLIDDVKQVASTVSGVNFSYVRRSTNRAAHALAREAVSESGPEEWCDTPPHYLVPVLAANLIN